RISKNLGTTVNHLAQFAAALVIIDFADCCAFKRRIESPANLFKKTLVNWLSGFPWPNALYDERPQFRIPPLGFQVLALRDWPSEHLIPRPDFEASVGLICVQEGQPQPFGQRSFHQQAVVDCIQ